MTRKLIALLAVLGLSASPVAHAQSQARPQAQAQSSEAVADRAASSYVLGPDDEIQVDVFGQTDLALKTRIKADGSINVPLLGRMVAANMTTADLSAAIARGYERSGYLVKPSVNVEVTNYSSKTVTVLGGIDKAGLYAIDRPYSAAAVIAKAGGVKEGGANVVIVTSAGSTETKRLSLISSPGAANYMVQPGDTLFVPPAEMVYVYGQVNTPGAFPYVPGMTFRQALARAGGPTLAGSARKYKVTRAGQDVKPALDEPVQPEDVLVIKEKLF